MTVFSTRLNASMADSERKTAIDRGSRCLACTLFLLILGSCTVSPQNSPADRAAALRVAEQEAKAEIVLMLSQWGSGYTALDMPRVASFYSSSPDFQWIEEGEVRYQSKQDIQASLEGLAGVKSLDFELIDPKVTVLSEDRASLSAQFAQAMDFGSGEPFVLKGAMTAILERTHEGWRFLSGHTSTITPPDQAGEDAR